MQTQTIFGVTKASSGLVSKVGGIAARLGAFVRGAGGLAGLNRRKNTLTPTLSLRERGSEGRGVYLEPLEGRQMLTLSAVGVPVVLETGGNQQSIAVAGDGSFVLAFTGLDDQGTGVYVQRFDSAGKAVDKSAILVNTQETGKQYEPDVALSADGSFMVVWTTQVQGQDGLLDVRGQRFSADGSKAGGEMVLQSGASGNQHRASVGALPSSSERASDGYFVAWEGQGMVSAQLFKHDGTAAFDTTFHVDGVVLENYTVERPKVGVSDDGTVAVTWQSLATGGTDGRIYGRFYKSDVSVEGQQFEIAQTTISDQVGAHVQSYDMAMAGDGYVVAVYDNFNAANGDWDVRAQVMTSEGTVDFDAFDVNVTTKGDQVHPTATFKADGTILVAWEGPGSVGDVAGEVVYARRFVGTGIGGPELTVSGKGDGYADGLYPVIGGHADAGFMVAWSGFGDATGQFSKVFGRLFEDVVQGPNALVTGNGITIANGSTVTGAGDLTAFGVVAQGGQEISHTFRVSNNGTATLTTKNLSVPAGFRIVEGLSGQINAGEFDDFTIALTSGTAGGHTGPVSFGTNVGQGQNFSFAVSGTVEQGQEGVYVITKNTPKADRTFIDDQNNRVVFTVQGNGSATLKIKTATRAFLSVSMAGTDGKSSLRIDVSAKGSAVGKNATATGLGTGVGSVRTISVAGTMNAFKAPEMSLTEDFVGTGAIKSVTLGNVGSGVQHEFKLGGTSKDRTDVSLGKVTDITFTSSAGLDKVKMVSWEDNVGIADVLSAPVVGAMSVTGKSAVKNTPAVAGDFEASIKLSGQGLVKTTSKTLGSLEIAGSMIGADGDAISVAGYAGKITVKGSVIDQMIKLSPIQGLAGSTGKLVGLTVGGSVTGTTLEVSGDAGDIRVTEWLGGGVTAQTVSSFTTVGRKPTKAQPVAVAGDFTGDLTINPAGAATKNNALGAVTIKGTMTGTSWTVTGNAGAVTAGGVSGAMISVTGKVASFTSKGQVLGDTELSAGLGVGPVSVINWLGGGISGASLGSLTVGGVFKLAGGGAANNNFTAGLSIGSEGGKSTGAITIAGSANSGMWETKGSVGAVTVGSATDLTVHVGGGLTSFTSKGAVSGVDLKAAGAVGAISAVSWKGGGLEGAKFASITTTGSGAAGNFSGNVAATGAGFVGQKNVPALIGSIGIGGALGEDGGGSVTLVAQGKIGAITVGSLFKASINAADDIASFTSKGTSKGGRITSGQKLGTVTSVNWLDGEITGQQINGIRITGKKDVATGDFTGKVTTTGTGGGSMSVVDMGSVTIAGSLGLAGGSETEFSVIRKMGLLTVGGIQGAKISAGQGWAGLTSKGKIDGLDALVGVEGEAGAFTGKTLDKVTVGSISNSTLHTGTLKAFSVKGQKATKTSAGFAGDVTNVQLTVDDAATKASALMLGGVEIAGALTDSVVRVTGNTGMVSVGNMLRSDFYVGVVSDYPAGKLAEFRVDFANLQASLKGFTVTGAGVAGGAASFVSSHVAAGQLLNVQLKLVAGPEGVGVVTGFAAGSRIKSYKRQIAAGSTAVVSVTERTAPGFYDQVEGTSFVLRVVLEQMN